MTRLDAFRILSMVWGRENVLGKHESGIIERAALPGETALDTLHRVAAIPPAVVAQLVPWDPRTREYYRWAYCAAQVKHARGELGY